MVGDIANALVWGALLHLALLVPTPLPAVARRGWLPAVGYVLPFVLQAGYLAVTLPGASSNLERLGLSAPVSHAAARTYPILIAVTMLVQYRAARDGATRQRLRWVLITFLVPYPASLALFG